jgi:hypothetical protein
MPARASVSAQKRLGLVEAKPSGEGLDSSDPQPCARSVPTPRMRTGRNRGHLDRRSSGAKGAARAAAGAGEGTRITRVDAARSCSARPSRSPSGHR